MLTHHRPITDVYVTHLPNLTKFLVDLQPLLRLWNCQSQIQGGEGESRTL